MLISKKADQCVPAWYVVCFSSGSVAVVSSEDLVFLVPCGSLEFLIKVSYEEGRAFEYARAGYMSATCRLKSGESDRVG
jgi:hypothetical protein